MDRRRLCLATMAMLFAGVAECGRGPLPASATPPPQAPALGRRWKHPSGVVLQYDTGLDLYVVLDMPWYYFKDDHFYRNFDGGWQIAVDIHGPWQAVDADQLPPGLAKRKRRKRLRDRYRLD